MCVRIRCTFPTFTSNQYVFDAQLQFRRLVETDAGGKAIEGDTNKNKKSAFFIRFDSREFL